MEEKPTKKLDQVLEGYKPIPMKSRMFYPRGFKLSENFVNAFHQEYDRLVGEGLNPKNLLERFGKALRFHVTEKRRYTQPVVEGGMSAHRPKTDAPGKASSNYTKPKEKAKDKKPEGQKQREHEEGQSGNKQTGY